MTQKEIISEIKDRHAFLHLLELNPGLVILKLGAEWCAPCKAIKNVVHGFFATSPDSVVCGDIDVDRSFDFYGYLKSKKMVNGIPVMLCYKKGNTNFIPDDSVTGADPVALDAFFKRCGIHLLNVQKANPPTANTKKQVVFAPTPAPSPSPPPSG